jgi:D123
MQSPTTLEAEFPPVTGQDILNCSFSSWYAKYYYLSPRARIIKPLPEEFITFLKSDGIVIPEESVPKLARFC